MKAIPTRYNGTEFRSRLEARWAAYFDLRDFSWVYEPVDFEGWAPDFMIHTPAAPIYAEVKPVLMAWNAEQKWLEFPSLNHPWVKAQYLKASERWRDCWVLLLGEEPDEWGRGFLHDPPPELDRCGLWNDAHAFLGQNEDGEWLSGREVRRLWREAGNIVQWLPDVART